MKNILTTTGMAALAVAGLQAKCYAQAVTVDEAKWWHVSASLRGFYDDNYTIAPDQYARESFGFEIRPGFDVGYQGEQFLVEMSGIYSARYFEDRDDDPWDQGFMGDLNGEYQFSENHVMRLSDNFTYSSEPTILDRGTAVTLLRADGTNMRNLGDAKYIGQFTRLIGLELGYGNTYYDFEQDGVGSYSAILDRVEQLFRAETRWTLTPTLVGIAGYWYEMVDFTGDEFIAAGSPFQSDVRNSSSHYFILGADYTVSPHCFLSVRGGGQNITYDEMPGEPDEWNGFGDISATFEYLEDSYFRIGARYGRNRTDVIGAVSPVAYSQLTLDQETAVAYGTVTYKLMERLTAQATGQLQFGQFEGGGYDGENEGMYLVGVSLLYDLTQWLGLEAGYNYDRVDSDDPSRSYSRNRVFIGVRGQY